MLPRGQRNQLFSDVVLFEGSTRDAAQLPTSKFPCLYSFPILIFLRISDYGFQFPDPSAVLGRADPSNFQDQREEQQGLSYFPSAGHFEKSNKLKEMASGFGESTSRAPLSPFCSGNTSNNSGDAGNFECNICFDLAQEPIITLCGHLFCWPCLYKWLHIHSLSKECPVCKAVIEEEKLVPLYGRGKSSTDPRSKSIPGVEIPHRPAGQRPETAPPPPPDSNAFAQHGFGFTGGFGGFAPMATARFGNFTLSAAFGGLIPSLFNIQVHGFPDANMYGAAGGFPYGFSNTFHGGHIHGFPQRTSQQQQQADFTLKLLSLIIGIAVILALIWS
nr:E3 ubiquitin-protein ligase RMA1-like [Coffea arabica]